MEQVHVVNLSQGSGPQLVVVMLLHDVTQVRALLSCRQAVQQSRSWHDKISSRDTSQVSFTATAAAWPAWAAWFTLLALAAP
jgi:hypothetical protein